jgi:hypothetical protein
VNRFNCSFLITHFCSRGTFICRLFHLNKNEWPIRFGFFVPNFRTIKKLQYSRIDSLRLKAIIFYVFLRRLVANKDDEKEADIGIMYDCMYVYECHEKTFNGFLEPFYLEGHRSLLLIIEFNYCHAGLNILFQKVVYKFEYLLRYHNFNYSNMKKN